MHEQDQQQQEAPAIAPEVECHAILYYDEESKRFTLGRTVNKTEECAIACIPPFEGLKVVQTITFKANIDVENFDPSTLLTGMEFRSKNWDRIKHLYPDAAKADAEETECTTA